MPKVFVGIKIVYTFAVLLKRRTASFLRSVIVHRKPEYCSENFRNENFSQHAGRDDGEHMAA
jgi:hypothetical protein